MRNALGTLRQMSILYCDDALHCDLNEPYQTINGEPIQGEVII